MTRARSSSGPLQWIPSLDQTRWLTETVLADLLKSTTMYIQGNLGRLGNSAWKPSQGMEQQERTTARTTLCSDAAPALKRSKRTTRRRRKFKTRQHRDCVILKCYFRDLHFHMIMHTHPYPYRPPAPSPPPTHYLIRPLCTQRRVPWINSKLRLINTLQLRTTQLARHAPHRTVQLVKWHRDAAEQPLEEVWRFAGGGLEPEAGQVVALGEGLGVVDAGGEAKREV